MGMSMYGSVSRDPRVRYYVAQYGFVWSMDLQGMLRFLRNGAEGGTWNLDDYGHCLHGTHTFPRGESGPKRWWGKYVIRPLDWEQEEFAFTLKDFEEALERP